MSQISTQWCTSGEGPLGLLHIRVCSTVIKSCTKITSEMSPRQFLLLYAIRHRYHCTASVSLPFLVSWQINTENAMQLTSIAKRGSLMHVYVRQEFILNRHLFCDVHTPTRRFSPPRICRQAPCGRFAIHPSARSLAPSTRTLMYCREGYGLNPQPSTSSNDWNTQKII